LITVDGAMPFRAETSRNYVEQVHEENMAQMAALSSHPQGP